MFLVNAHAADQMFVLILSMEIPDCQYKGTYVVDNHIKPLNLSTFYAILFLFNSAVQDELPPKSTTTLFKIIKKV